jgi:4a-hydroxytetrahydrobiopterin dehydratase
MRALWSRRSQHDYLTDALTQLSGWSREGRHLRRTLVVDDAQHAALTERIKVVADALHLRPDIRRLDGHTQIQVGCSSGVGVTEGEVTLAARIEDAYRAVVGDTVDVADA